MLVHAGAGFSLFTEVVETIVDRGARQLLVKVEVGDGRTVFLISGFHQRTLKDERSALVGEAGIGRSPRWGCLDDGAIHEGNSLLVAVGQLLAGDGCIVEVLGCGVGHLADGEVGLQGALAVAKAIADVAQLLPIDSQRVERNGFLGLVGSAAERPVAVMECCVGLHGVDNLTAYLVVDVVLVLGQLERLGLVGLCLGKAGGVAFGHQQRGTADVAVGIVGELADETLDDFGIVWHVVLVVGNEEVNLCLLHILG